MARQMQQKTKRAGKSAKPSAKAALAGAVDRLEAQARVLENERDALKAQLAAAQERITELEQAHEQAVNRIDWVIDSLHKVVDVEK